MKPLTRYELLEDANRHPPYAGMRPSDDGEWYDKREADARLAELESAEKWLGEVMAAIHGDGGHYVAKHGAEKAALDAIAKFRELEADKDAAGIVIDELRATIAEREAEIDENNADADARIAALKAERDAALQAVDELRAERDALRTVLVSGHMQRVLRFVVNHAGKGLHGALHDSAEWIEKQIEKANNACAPQDQNRGR